MPKQNLAFALDYPSIELALPPLQQLASTIGWAKVGLELFTRHGPSCVQLVAQCGVDVFLDLKLHDIPETVDRAVANACETNARLLTIHVSGGSKMIEKAVQRAQGSPLTLVGVTVLTSLDAADLNAMGVTRSPADQVVALAKLGWAAGLRAFVCSPREVGALRTALGPEAILITPGIRPAGASVQDQKRVATPASAIQDGANIIVVGRPIRDAQDPTAVAEAIVKEIDDAQRSS